MSEIRLSVIQFVEHPDLLNDQSLSATQRVILKSTYGEPLTPVEIAIYLARTGREKYEEVEVKEETIMAGRRSGKTSKIACYIVAYEAFRDHGLPYGEEAVILLIATQIKQARIAFRHIRRCLQKSRILSNRIVSLTKDEIKLDNGITIACYPASYVAVRGVTIVTVICDEMAFWRHDSNAANPEEEILDALRPGMTDVVNAKLVKVSTPFSKQGTLWNDFWRRKELDFPVWQVSTSEMNPSIKAAELERYRKKNEQKYRREYLAEFAENITDYLDAEAVDHCVVRGRKALPPVPGFTYCAALDPAFGHDDFALAIEHAEADGKIVLDLLVSWRGTKGKPLSCEHVLKEIKCYLDCYGITRAVGDQHCFAVIHQQLLKLGISYQQVHFGSNARAEIFGNLKYLLLNDMIEMLDHREFLDQLLNLEERAMDGGRIDVRPAGTMRDDLAVVVGLCCSEMTKQPVALPEPELGLIDRGRMTKYFIPGQCPVEVICGNYPRCLDEGCCQGFKDTRG